MEELIMQNILIIEDDEKLRHELEIFLNRNGFNSKSIETFENTIQDIINENSDLILLDINLPNYDGEFVLKELRKIIDTPIIMVTSRDTEIDELISMNYGADNYVTKPFNSQILLAKINAILKRRKTSRINFK
jgi:DNA-binding response OmpR family regulator